MRRPAGEGRVTDELLTAAIDELKEGTDAFTSTIVGAGQTVERA
jgi:hypothetical protein